MIINVNPESVISKIGIELSLKEIENILKRLRFPVVAKREDTLEIKVPSFRSDVSKTIDIIEEICRIYGYNNIPEKLFKPQIDPGASPGEIMWWIKSGMFYQTSVILKCIISVLPAMKILINLKSGKKTFSDFRTLYLWTLL